MLKLSAIRGQDRAIGILLRAWASDRMHHANLLHGPAGVGKRTVATAMAALINCERWAPGVTDACGECRACKLLVSGNHPDLVRVEPDGKFIKIEQVRSLQQATRYRPSEGRRRVIIIESAETLREEAANALLKTLEEPTGETLFFLVTAQPHLLLSTIRSRCQPVAFGMLSPEDLTAILRSEGRDPALVAAVSRVSEGSLERAHELLESPVYAARHDWFNVLLACAQGGPERALRQGDELGRNKDVLPSVLALWRSLLRDAALMASGASARRMLHPDADAEVQRLARVLGRDSALHAIGRLDEVERMLQGNVNPRMLVETFLLDVAHRAAVERDA